MHLSHRFGEAGSDLLQQTFAWLPLRAVPVQNKNAATTDPTSGAVDWPIAIALWGARLAWLLLAVLGGAALGDSLQTRSRAVQLTGTIGLWALWAAVALAMAIPSVVGLTTIRTITPAALVAAGLAGATGAGAVDTIVCAALAAVATAFVFSGEFGEACAQASAYGDERRFILRAPAPFLLPMVVSWCALCAAAATGPLLVAAASWSSGVALTTVAMVLAWFLGRRYHRLSRRWLVLVPAGVVVHDHLVLAETAMFQKLSVIGIGLALADTEAADLTGPAGGNAIEVTLSEMPTVVLAPSRSKPAGSALHVRAVLVAPTRPGRALVEAAARGLPVG